MRAWHILLGICSVTLLSIAPTSAQSKTKPTVTRDAVTGEYVVQTIVDGMARQFRFMPATRLQFGVESKVKFDGVDHYEYDYLFSNDGRSQQELYSIALLAGLPSEITQSPAGWEPNIIRSRGRIYWYRITDGYGLQGIPPGTSLGGFSIRSLLLPGPIDVQGRGNVGPPQVPPGTPGELIEALDDVMRRDFVVARTIGPRIPPGINEPELKIGTQLSRVRSAFVVALMRSEHEAARRTEGELSKAIQAFDSGNDSSGLQWFENARASARELTETAWLRALRDALEINFDHIERRFVDK